MVTDSKGVFDYLVDEEHQIISIHRCFVEHRSRLGWIAECGCGFKGAKRLHPLLAERDADKHLQQYG